MRLLLDEMYPPRLAAELRARELDVLAVLDVLDVPELAGIPDREVLAWATGQDRVTVTENVRDFSLLAGEATSGLLLVNAARWPRTRSGQVRLAVALEAWAGRSVPAQHEGVLGWL